MDGFCGARVRTRVDVAAEWTPTVEIIINNYNYGRYLGRAVESALGQDYPRVRVTVVDDGSTDDSLTVARSYRDRVRVIAKAHGGQASAVNAGFGAVNGEVVCFLDADDMLRPDFASMSVRALRDHSAAKVVFRAEVVDWTGRATGQIEPSGQRLLSHGDLRRATLSHPFDLVWPPFSAHAFSACALADVLPVPEDDYPGVGADWYVTHAASLMGDVVAVERVGVSYRLHEANAYFVAGTGLDLQHIRSTIAYAGATRRQIRRLADASGLSPSDAVSTSEAAACLVSLRLEPERHPLTGDRTLDWWSRGVRSAWQRTDIPWRTRIVTAGWFTAAALAPPRWLAPLAGLFFVPRRGGRVALMRTRARRR